jgi:hypothetical protein
MYHDVERGSSDNLADPSHIRRVALPHTQTPFNKTASRRSHSKRRILALAILHSTHGVGRRITFLDEKRDLEIVGVSANLRYGALKEESPMTVFVAVSQVSPEGTTYAAHCG